MFVSPDRSAVHADGMASAGATCRRLIQSRSPQWVVAWTLRAVLAPEWGPASAAAELQRDDCSGLWTGP
jgi:hypothetical protein